MLSEQWGILLVSVLLGCILYQLKQLRMDVKECVPDKHCRTMMKAHEDRIERLENIHQPNAKR